MDHILTEQEINIALNRLSNFSEALVDVKNEIMNIIDHYESDPVVKSFYESGSFGQKEKIELLKVREAIIRYEQSINGNGKLVDVTRDYFKNQLEELNSN